MNSVLMF